LALILPKLFAHGPWLAQRFWATKTAQSLHSPRIQDCHFRVGDGPTYGREQVLLIDSIEALACSWDPPRRELLVIDQTAPITSHTEAHLQDWVNRDGCAWDFA